MTIGSSIKRLQHGTLGVVLISIGFSSFLGGLSQTAVAADEGRPELQMLVPTIGDYRRASGQIKGGPGRVWRESSSLRRWTSANGSFSVEAAYVSSDEKSVTLKRKKDGKEIIVRRSDVSEGDRTLVNRIERGKVNIESAGAQHLLVYIGERCEVAIHGKEVDDGPGFRNLPAGSNRKLSDRQIRKIKPTITLDLAPLTQNEKTALFIAMAHSRSKETGHMNAFTVAVGQYYVARKKDGKFNASTKENDVKAMQDALAELQLYVFYKFGNEVVRDIVAERRKRGVEDLGQAETRKFAATRYGALFDQHRPFNGVIQILSRRK